VVNFPRAAPCGRQAPAVRELSGIPAEFVPVRPRKPELKLGTLYSLRSIDVKGTQRGGQEVGNGAGRSSPAGYCFVIGSGIQSRAVPSER
jgi:hypothetical protein